MNQRTLTFVFLASLALNLFLLGAAGVHLVHRQKAKAHLSLDQKKSPPGGRGEVGVRGGPPLLRELVRAAGGPGDPRVKALWKGNRAELGDLRRRMHEARERVLISLERDPLDPAELSRALEEALQLRVQADRRANEGATDLAARLTPLERQSLRGPPPR